MLHHPAPAPDPSYWFGTIIRFLGLLTVGVQDLEIQGRDQYTIAAKSLGCL